MWVCGVRTVFLTACMYPNFHVMQFYMWRVILGVPPVDVGCFWEEVSEVFALGGVVSGGGALCLP